MLSIGRPTRTEDDDPPALRALLDFDVPPRGSRRGRAAMGYQPGLDGVRALAVLVVIGYHAGFGWMRGGWIGVEVFFVVSGFLITSLLIEERERRGRVGLAQFWLRRARRLLPALALLLVAVAAAVLVAGTSAQRSDVRRDLPWALGYAGNWGQIIGGVPYYGGEPSPLRHLWSLAIEEQFYLLWPLVFVAISATRVRAATAAKVVGAVALAAMTATFWLQRGMPAPVDVFGGVDRVNFMYLSTFTRAGGLLLGAAAAFVWRPWQRRSPHPADAGRALDAAGTVAGAALLAVAVVATLTAAYVYQWLLALVSILALVVVLVVVHPAATTLAPCCRGRPSSPSDAVATGCTCGTGPSSCSSARSTARWGRSTIGLAVTVVLSELSYRFVEGPVRQGALGRWLRTEGPNRRPALLGGAVALVVLTAGYAAVDHYDPAAGGADAVFAAPTTAPAPAAGPAATTGGPVASAPPAPAAVRVAVVGDSQAHSLVRNAPDGLSSTFAVADGSLDGCSVYDRGRVHSRLASFRNTFTICRGWQREWAEAVTRQRASVALVALGAWDVFDLETGDGTVLAFGTPAWERYVSANLQSGIDALTAAGAHVALLEVPCMRPVAAEGAGVPPLPERGDDQRVAHVNTLFRSIAAANPGTVTFVTGPPWCRDPAIATDVGMRWDGVHVYKPGAKLIFDAIAPALLAL